LRQTDAHCWLHRDRIGHAVDLAGICNGVVSVRPEF
jgi:hypothetical protein